MARFVSRWFLLLVILMAAASPLAADTVALWLFDEQAEVYPSSLLNDAGGRRYFMVIGRGARIVEGKFGRALEPVEPAPLKITKLSRTSIDEEGGPPAGTNFGLVALPKPAGRTVEPMHWMNATFAALATSGEKHLRTPVFANATDTRLNLGDFDWTVEFWFQPNTGSGEGVVFEVGEGPRGENDRVTRLTLNADRRSFTLYNQPSGVRLAIPTMLAKPGWHHLAFVYSAKEQQLRHYVDGAVQRLPQKAALKALPHGDEAYFSVGRDGLWNRPLPGRLDEMRFSDHQAYTAAFTPPGSFSLTYGKGLPKVTLKAGPPLLFGKTAGEKLPVQLGSRKHLFIDDALIAEKQNVTFVPQPPKRKEKVLDHAPGHLAMVEDEQGVLRLYYKGPSDSLAVMTSKDGIRWEKPDLGREYQRERNIVLDLPVGLGMVFIDPNAPPENRWRYVSGIRRQGIFVFTSKDGWSFTPHETAALPFSAGSQSSIYYDDQRQVYVAQHRSDYGKTPAGSTSRRFVMSETKDLLTPWPFEHITPQRTAEIARLEPIKNDRLDPWYLDNGPITPTGFGVELPTVIAHDPKIDPVATDVYTTKAVKYPWAPDTYLAFPSMYLHYWEDGPPARQELGRPERKRGSGVIEVQLAVSRDGLDWKRYPRPAYVPIGGDGSDSVHMFILTQGIFRRGDEIWQYVGGHGGNGINYHSAYVKRQDVWPLYRLVQRLDGFVAAEADYTGGMLKTKPLVFDGKQLHLNIDASGVAYAQVGFLDERGQPIPGFSVDDCVYINGDHLQIPVEWMGKGTDVSALAGKTVQLVFRLRGAKLFAMQFARQ